MCSRGVRSYISLISVVGRAAQRTEAAATLFSLVSCHLTSGWCGSLATAAAPTSSGSSSWPGVSQQLRAMSEGNGTSNKCVFPPCCPGALSRSLLLPPNWQQHLRNFPQPKPQSAAAPTHSISLQVSDLHQDGGQGHSSPVQRPEACQGRRRLPRPGGCG